MGPSVPHVPHPPCIDRPWRPRGQVPSSSSCKHQAVQMSFRWQCIRCNTIVCASSPTLESVGNGTVTVSFGPIEQNFAVSDADLQLPFPAAV